MVVKILMLLSKIWNYRLFTHTPLFYLAGLLSPCLSSAEPTPEELEQWFNEDDKALHTQAVNEGELTFLEHGPEQAPHHHQNVVHLDADSADSGWIRLEQCHENLDAVSRLQITFKAGNIRQIKVRDSHLIDKAWAEAASVQLEGVKTGARLCLEAESRALKKRDDGVLVLSNGPYMRRFLDGYYPMRVSMQVYFPEQDFELLGITPTAQTGFLVTHGEGEVSYNALFEGVLTTEMRFRQR